MARPAPPPWPVLPEPWERTVTARFQASAGPHALATAMGIATVAILLLAFEVLTDIPIDGVIPSGIVIGLLGGSIFTANRACTRLQRRRWVEALGVAPSEGMVVGLTGEAVAIWDLRGLDRGDAQPIVELPRPGPTLERWPAWAKGATGVRLRVAGATLPMSIWSGRSDVDQMVAALAADAVAEVRER